MPLRRALAVGLALAFFPAIATAEPAPAFHPADVTPPFKDTAQRGDGAWSAVPDPDAANDPPLAYKTTLHPDPKRGFSVATVLAMDLSRLQLYAVAGTAEPESRAVPAARRPGVVPADRLPRLFAAFNGGFKAAHGKYGMKVDGDEILPPKDDSCTVVLDANGGIRIATWTALQGREQIATFRQAPPCLVENGQIGAAVDAANINQYGLSVAGETIIRRSALGIDAAKTTLYYVFADGLTPRALANAMQAVGAADATQLDVNYSFPRLLFYVHPPAPKKDEGELYRFLRMFGDLPGPPPPPPVVRAPLVTSVQFRANEYFGAPEPRDFFYLVRKN